MPTRGPLPSHKMGLEARGEILRLMSLDLQHAVDSGACAGGLLQHLLGFVQGLHLLQLGSCPFGRCPKIGARAGDCQNRGAGCIVKQRRELASLDHRVKIIYLYLRRGSPQVTKTRLLAPEQNKPSPEVFGPQPTTRFPTFCFPSLSLKYPSPQMPQTKTPAWRSSCWCFFDSSKSVSAWAQLA